MSVSKHIKEHIELGLFRKRQQTTLWLQNAGQTIATGAGGATDIVFDTAIIDQPSAWNAAAKQEVIVPSWATKMDLALHCEWTTSGVGLRSLRYFVNGLAVAGNYTSISDTRTSTGTISDHLGNSGIGIPCIAGDVITMRVRQDSGGNLDVIASRATFINIVWYS